MPIIESVGLAAETIHWSYELYKVVRASVAYPFSKDSFRTTSSLTTLEFSYEQGHQIAHFVQDRQIVFTKEGTLPSFHYGTEGEDFIDGLLINDMVAQCIKTGGTSGVPFTVTQEKPKKYPKKYQLGMALLAHSINGFTKPTETHSMRIVRWVGRSRVAIIFPDDKKPISFGMFYRDDKDDPSVRKHPGYEACSLKKTTRDRWILLWEFNNVKTHRTYTLEWTWP